MKVWLIQAARGIVSGADILAIGNIYQNYWPYFTTNAQKLLFPTFRTGVIFIKFELGQPIRSWLITFLLLRGWAKFFTMAKKSNRKTYKGLSTYTKRPSLKTVILDTSYASQT